MSRLRYLLACLAVAFAGCAHQNSAFQPGSGAGAPRPYTLQAGDQIAIRHPQDLAYYDEVTIAPDGRISVPGLPAPVLAQGQTVEALRDRLVRLYREADLVTDPSLTISVQRFGTQQAFIGGEVRRPGMLNLPSGVRTLVQALVAGGGPLPTANLGEILVLRTNRDGHSLVLKADLTRVLDGSDLAQNVPVQPLDVIIVPRTGVASLDVWVDQYIRQALPIPVRVLLDAVWRPFPRF